MARPQRCRRICGMPQVSSFCPAQQQGQQPILLSLDEYEVIRLVDLEEKAINSARSKLISPVPRYRKSMKAPGKKLRPAWYTGGSW